jgi:hypothetical protein
MSLSPTLSAASAKTLSQSAMKKPFTTTQQFLATDIAKNNALNESKITVTSNYFLIKTNVIISDQTLTLYTLVNRITSGSQVYINVLWQSQGTL